MVNSELKSLICCGKLKACDHFIFYNCVIFAQTAYYSVFTIDYSPLTMKYTQTTLDKLETIPEEAGYVLRYERGTFQSGYCILEERKVVVLNKFLQTEGRINTLLDLIPQLDINTDILSEESKKLYLDIISKLETEGNEK
jgi:hypothetical protein